MHDTYCSINILHLSEVHITKTQNFSYFKLFLDNLMQLKCENCVKMTTVIFSVLKYFYF